MTDSQDHNGTEEIAVMPLPKTICVSRELMFTQARIAELESLLGRYADQVCVSEGIYFELAGPEGDYIIELAERAASIIRAEAGPKPKHTGQYSVPQIRD
jgi:hypothetical protein